MLDVRVMVQANTGSWQTVEVNAFVGHDDVLAWVLTTYGQKSFAFIASPRWLPADANVTTDVPQYYTNVVPPLPSPLPPYAASQRFQASNVDGYFLGDHGFTWLTLAELLAYDWSGKWVYPIDIALGRKRLIMTAGEACGEFYSTFIPHLQALAAQHGVTNDNLRILVGLYNH